jgi:hypothetical protein
MAQKSILEQALLQVKTLEDAVKANAKGILASTMKQELNDLLKEQEDEKDPDEEEKDVTGTPEDDETSDKESTAGEELPTGDEELPAVDNELEGGEPETEMPSEDEDSEDVLDMTGASEEEVLKVFKAMKPEDGIVVKKEGDTVQFSDEGNEYIIKLDDDATETPETPEGGEELPTDELSEQQVAPEPAGDNQEIVYEIELDDEDDETKECEAKEEVKTSDGKPFEKKVGKVGKKLEAKENVTVHDTVSVKDGQPFDKTSPQTGVKKLETDVTKAHKVEAKEQEGIKRPGTALPGTGGPQTKEPGKGGNKVTQAEPFGPTAIKGTKPAEKKEPGKGGNSPEQVESKPGTPLKGSGLKPVVKEPKEQECKECDKSVKEVEATEAVRTKWNAHGNRAAEPRTGIKSKKVHYAGSRDTAEVDLNEQVETLKTQNDEYRKALVLFKDKLNEVAVFNANLAYATRLFTEHSTTKQEKLEILKRFDTISTITESKNLYTTIKADMETKKPISEAAVEKIASSPSSSATEMLSESKAYENPQFARMKELMRKIK